MKRIRYYIFTLLCMFFFPLITHAECDYQRMAELNKIASNVQFSYSYDLDGSKEPQFGVNVTNITSDIYIEYSSTNWLFVDRVENVSEVFIDFYEGSTLTFKINSADSSCYGKLLATRYISTPVYNEYYLTPECKKYPSFKYCSAWLGTSITDEQFRREFEKYNNSYTNVLTDTEKPGIGGDLTIYVTIFFAFFVLLTFIFILFKKRRFYK